MTKEKIARKINSYTHKKLIIVGLLLLSVFMMCVCVMGDQFLGIRWAAYGAIISYFFMALMIIIACRFNLNESLMKVITVDDYKEILKYISEIPNNISIQKYYDGLLMIKRTLDEMVYYHTNEVDETFRQHLCYLQSIFLNEKDVALLSSVVLNKSYLKKISSILLQQINNGYFSEIELEENEVKDERIKKQIHISEKMLTNLFNAILIVIVIFKIMITINDNWYYSINNYLFLRVIYNTSVDIIAVVLAIITWQKR